jgi:beta-lactamase regulating signal transducer with metallopeptidase domain
MSEWASLAMPWLIQTLAVGASLLLIASLLMIAIREPSRRRTIGAMAVRIALLVPLLVLAPKWLRIPVNEDPAPAKNVVEQSQPMQSEQRAEAASRVAITPWLPVTPEGGTSFTFVVPDRSESETTPIQAPAKSEAEPTPAPSALAPIGSNPVTVSNLPWRAWLKDCYAAVAALFVARWLLAQVALARLVRRSRPASRSLVNVMGAMTTINSRRPRLLIIEDLPAPVCCGLWRPVVLLPKRVAETSDEEALRWVFAHELSHLRRGDAWTAFWFGLAAAIYFPLPWFWRLKQQVSLAQEYVADAEAAALTRAEEYAAFLVNLSRLSRPARQLAGVSGVLGSPSELYRRITMLLDKTKRVDGSCPRRWSLIATCSFLSLAIVLSGLGLTRTVAASGAADDPAPKAKDDQKQDQSKPNQPKKDDDEKFVRPPRVGPGPRPLIPQFGNAANQEELQKELQKMAEDLQKQLQNGGLNAEELQKIARQLADEIRKQQPQFAPDPQQFGNGEELQKHMQKMAEDLQKQFQQGGFNGGFAFPNFGHGGFGSHTMGSGRLGVMIEKPSAVIVEQLDLPKDQGLVLSEVKADSAAAKAGLKANDIILEFNGKPVVSDPQEFRKLVADASANKPVDAVVLRKGRRETIKGMTLPEAKAEADNPFGNFPGFGGQGFNMPNVQVFPRAGQKPPARPFGNGIGFGGGIGHGMSMQIANDSFTINSHEENLNITVTGKIEDSKMTVNSVKIMDGTDKVEVDSVNRVPEKYKEKVQALLNNIHIAK